MSEMLLKHFDLLAKAPDSVTRLRERILTLAVQGKLVPQDPADEPASVLLQKIRAEKDRLIAEGKIKRDKPLAPITDEEKPFELPQGWEWSRGGGLFAVIRGVTYQKTDAHESILHGHLPLLRANNIRGSINFDDLVYVPKGLIASDQLLQSGDFVVCLASGSKHLVGKAAVFPGGVNCSFGAFCGAIRPWQSMDYLSVYLASPLYRDEVSQASAGIGINNLKGSTLLGLCIPVPPAAEQSRIVARVEELMHLCDALEAKGKLDAAQHTQLVQTLLGTLTDSASPAKLAANWQRVAEHFDLLLDRPEAVDALEQTILQLAVRGLLVPQDPSDEPAIVLLQKIRSEKDKLIAEGKIKRDKPLAPITDEEKPFELPQGWEWVRIDGVSEVQGGIQKTPLRRPVKNHHPYLRVANVQRDAFKLTDIERYELADDELARWSLFANDLLIVEGNGSEDEIGRCAVWSGQIADCVYQNHLIRVRCVEPPCVQFLKIFLNSPSGTDEMKRLAITTSGLYNLSVGKIRNFAFPLPPLAEQSRIVTRVEELRQLCSDLRQRLTDAREKQGNLAQALVNAAGAA
ncbi:restriction endonuclease subunit S [Malikia spinosa]|uniref:Restriction endonuclease subunit S n=1 Tax=Malikia spinosa TaxID=86180 RepID=A0A7C9MXQ6_9BURK|nr:restriction endonuclease subunit S [Malikia spinosa]MYZ52541.1 restriction endonuclease subunit S [Malikia spinosa]